MRYRAARDPPRVVFCRADGMPPTPRQTEVVGVAVFLVCAVGGLFPIWYLLGNEKDWQMGARPPPLVGLAPTGKRLLVTTHTRSGLRITWQGIILRRGTVGGTCRDLD